MAKNWIKKAIKHPGRCTPGSPNYDCPKGSPQWNLAQRFKHGDLHKKEDGGMTASDNVDMGYYSNPLKYFAAMGINISDDDCLECGGKVYANNGLNIDSTLNANKNLNWVQRLYQKNTPAIFLPGEYHPSTHYMENADNFVYPTIIQNEDEKLEYLGDKAYDYAMKTNTAIKFKTPEEAEYFAKNYKKGKGVLKKFNMGGKIEANNGANAKKQIPNSEQIKAWNKAKHDLKLQLQKEGKDISYLDHNLDYAKTFLQGYNKQNNFIFGEDKSPEEIVKFWQEYNNDVYSDPTYKSSLLPFEQTYQKSVENNERNDSINPNNRSNPDGVLGSFTINDTTPLRVLKKKGTDESGEAVIILNPYSPEKFTIEKNSIIKKNTPINNKQLLQELYTIPNFGVQPGTSPSFQNGGIVKAWIQKFSNGGYIADEGFPAGQELTQPTTNYYNWGNYGNQNSFLTPEQINQKPFQNTVPLANTNMPQNIGTNYFTPYDASNDQVNKDNQLANSMMKSSSKGLSDPVSMGLDVGGKSLDATANLLGSLGKDNSKAKAFGQGASGAMKVSDSITKPFESIPIAGKAISTVGKTLGFIIGGALEARRQGIENEEMDKYNKVQEYTSRNTQTAQQPSYYGQYMSKYGSNIKNLEQRLIDDIFSDYDKFMKLT